MNDISSILYDSNPYKIEITLQELIFIQYSRRKMKVMQLKMASE